MELFHVQYDCGDYYCDGMHTVGVFSSQQKAADAIVKYILDYGKAVAGNGKNYAAEYQYGVAIRTLDQVEGYGE